MVVYLTWISSVIQWYVNVATLSALKSRLFSDTVPLWVEFEKSLLNQTKPNNPDILLSLFVYHSLFTWSAPIRRGSTIQEHRLMLMSAKIPKLLLYLKGRGGRVTQDEGVSQRIDNGTPCQGMLPGSFLCSWMGSNYKWCSLRPVTLSQSVSPSDRPAVLSPLAADS